MQKVFFRIENAINIILAFSKGKVKKLQMCAKIVLSINTCEFLKLWDRLKKICDQKCCWCDLEVLLKYSWYQLQLTPCVGELYVNRAGLSLFPYEVVGLSVVL